VTRPLSPAALDLIRARALYRYYRRHASSPEAARVLVALRALRLAPAPAVRRPVRARLAAAGALVAEVALIAGAVPVALVLLVLPSEPIRRLYARIDAALARAVVLDTARPDRGSSTP
jgi:hypothetical protein